MSSETIADVTELDEINRELKVLRDRSRVLSIRKKAIEKKLVKVLDERNEPGMKYRDITIIAEEKGKHAPIKKKERVSKGVHVLEKHGIRDAEKVLKELVTEMKGDKIVEKVVKLRKIGIKTRN
jgi:hypothetical protein